MLLSKLVGPLIKDKSEVLQFTLLIPIDLFWLASLVEGSYKAYALGGPFSSIDAGSVSFCLHAFFFFAERLGYKLFCLAIRQ